jgi:hypothetical protein
VEGRHVIGGALGDASGGEGGGRFIDQMSDRSPALEAGARLRSFADRRRVCVDPVYRVRRGTGSLEGRDG